MKLRKVQMDVKSARPARSVGDAPAIGKVAKVSDAGPGSHRRGERRSHGKEHLRDQEEPGAWLIRLGMVSAVVLGIGLMGLMLYLWGKRYLDLNMPGGTAASEVSKAPSPATRDKHELYSGALDEEAALRLVRRGLSIRYPARVHDCFRLGPATSATDVVTFLEGMKDRDGLVSRMEFVDELKFADHVIVLVNVECNLGERTTTRLAMLVNDGDDKWKIDYDAFARRADPSWQDLLDGKVEDGLVRVTVRPGDSSASNQSSWDHYVIEACDVQKPLIGHCRQGTAQAKALSAQNFSEGAGLRMTLVVRPMVGSPDGHFEITRVLAQDWVVFDPVYDQQFH